MYANHGKYAVSLSLLDANNCTSFKSDTLTIWPRPIASFTSDTICFRDSTNHTSQSTISLPLGGAITTYRWTFGGGGTSSVQQTKHVHPTAGLHTTELHVTDLNGCTDSISQTVVVDTLPVALFAADTVCFGNQTSFTDKSFGRGSTLNTWGWDLGNTQTSNIQNPTITYSAAGSYNVKLSIADAKGCKDDTVQLVVVDTLPVAVFSVNDNCLGDSSLFTDNSQQGSNPFTSWKWKFGDGDSSSLQSPKHLYANHGKYQVYLLVLDDNNCAADTTDSLTIWPRPIASFTSDTICFRDSTNHTSQSTITLPLGGAITTYRWTFGGGGTSSVQQTKHVYPTAGLHTTELHVTDLNGCTDSISQTVVVDTLPVALFAADTVCFGNQTSFTDKSFGRGSTLNTWGWDLGNTQTSNIQNPTITYSAAGSYNVKLSIADAKGCKDDTVQLVVVDTLPVAVFSVNDNCLGDSSLFTDNSQQGSNPFTSWKWKFGDGDSSSLQSPKHLYANHGKYQVYLLVLDDNNCAADTTDSLTIWPRPIASFTSDTICFRDSTNHTSQSTITLPLGGAITSYRWTFGGGGTSSLQQTKHIYPSAGLHTTELHLTDVNGCTDSISQTVVVDTLPLIVFTVDSVCLNDTVSFINNSRGAAWANIVSWKWDFGNADSSLLKAPAYLYPNYGVFGVTLSAIDSKGCRNSSTDSLIIYPLPTAIFNFTHACQPAPACTGSPVTFNSTSTIPSLGGGISTYNWDIDNNTVVDYTVNPAIHRYALKGKYTIVHEVISPYGCFDTAHKIIEITEAPIAVFSVDSTNACGPLQVVISDSSKGFVSNYSWTIFAASSGIGTPIFSSTSKNPNPVPALLPGRLGDTSYVVQLIVSSCCGADTAYDTIIVKPLPIVDFRTSVNSGCSPLRVNITADSLIFGSTNYLILNFGDGSKNDTIYPNSLSPIWRPSSHYFFYNGPSADTTYYLSVIGVNGCGRDTATQPIRVEPNRVFSFFTISKTKGCAPLAVTFTSFATGATQISYDFNYDSTRAIPNFPVVTPNKSYTHTFLSGGKFLIAQFVTNGCSIDTSFQEIEVFPQPEANFTVNDSICNNVSLAIINNSSISSGSINGYEWDFDNGDNDVIRTPTYTYPIGGNYTISLIVTSNLGCKDTATALVRVFGKPTVDFSLQNSCLNAQPVVIRNLSRANNDPVIGTDWQFGDGNSSSTWSPLHSYLAPGTYSVSLKLVTHNGCADSLTKSIVLYPVPLADFSSSYLNGDSCGLDVEVSFINKSTGANGATWYFNWNGDRTDSSSLISPSKKYNVNEIYLVKLVAKNAFNCADTQDRKIGVYPIPIADLSLLTTSGCLPIEMEYNDLSTYSWEGINDSKISERKFKLGDQWYPIQEIASLFTESGVFNPLFSVRSNFGCSDTIQLQNKVSVYPVLIADFEIEEVENTTFYFNNTSILSSGIPNYTWTFGDSTKSIEESPTHKYDVNAYYRELDFEVCLIIDDSHDCKSDTCKPLHIEPWTLFVPNAMTPERGKGEETVFLPKGLNLSTYHLQIFDTWGNKLWESTLLNSIDGSPLEAWDGTYRGTLVPHGTYVWRIDAVFEGGRVWDGKYYEGEGTKRVGTISVIR